MPRDEPSVDCWDWPICMQGQRSRGKGLGSRTGRDRSLLGRHRLGKRIKAWAISVTIKTGKRAAKRADVFYHTRHRPRRMFVSGAQSIHAAGSELTQSIVITLSPPHRALSFHKTHHRRTARRRKGQLVWTAKQKPQSTQREQSTGGGEWSGWVIGHGTINKAMYSNNV